MTSVTNASKPQPAPEPGKHGRRMSRVGFLAKHPPVFWRKARALDKLVPLWQFDRLSPDSGYLSCVLKYDTPNGNTLCALNYSDISRYVQVDKYQFDQWGYLVWEYAIATASKEIIEEVGLYVMLCDIAVFGSPFAPFTIRGND